MKKLFVLVLVVTVMFVSSCSTSTKATTAVTTDQETAVITTETATETVVETIVESHLNYYRMNSTTESTTETTAAKKKETTQKSSDTTETAVATVSNNRQVTGDGGSLPFQTGDTVLGAAIQINGKTFPSCVIKNAPMDGVVISGVIWPWEEEIGNLTIISNDEILAPVSTVPTETTTTPTTIPIETTPVTVETTATTITKVRTPTGVGQSLSFQAGDTVVGWSAIINGQPYEDVNGIVIYNSSCGGTITDGVVNPWPEEITNQTVITP